MEEMNEIFSKNFQKFLERRGLTQTDIDMTYLVHCCPFIGAIGPSVS